MVIYAKPNLNGNKPADFKNYGSKLFDVALDARSTLNQVRSEVFHGRNYQISDGPAYSRALDLKRVKKLQEALDDLEALAQEVYFRGVDAE